MILSLLVFFTAFSVVMADLWKKDEDDDDGYSSGAVNPTALKSQVSALMD